jgi:hypothetical protein
LLNLRYLASSIASAPLKSSKVRRGATILGKASSERFGARRSDFARTFRDTSCQFLHTFADVVTRNDRPISWLCFVSRKWLENGMFRMTPCSMMVGTPACASSVANGLTFDGLPSALPSCARPMPSGTSGNSWIQSGLVVESIPIELGTRDAHLPGKAVTWRTRNLREGMPGKSIDARK